MKGKLAELEKEDNDLSDEQKAAVAQTYADDKIKTMEASWRAAGKASEGKKRPKRRKLEGKEKERSDRRNEKRKAAMKVFKKRRWLCKSCNWGGCTHGNKAKSMPKHLKKNPQCRVSENDYLSSFETDGWEE